MAQGERAKPQRPAPRAALPQPPAVTRGGSGGRGEQQLQGAKDRLRAPPRRCHDLLGRGCALQPVQQQDQTGQHRQSRAGEGKTLSVVGPCTPSLHSSTPPLPTDTAPHPFTHHKAPGAGSLVSAPGTRHRQCWVLLVTWPGPASSIHRTDLTMIKY